MAFAIFGILLSLSTFRLAFPKGTKARPFLFGALIIVHMAATYAYFVFAGDKIEVDAVRYYVDPHGVAERAPLLPGTVFVYKVVQILRALGATLLDQFFLFQCFGMIGIALLIRTVNEVRAELERGVPLLFYGALFLPGLHFWTVAPGKDGLVFAAAALAIWAMLSPQRRLGWFGIALVAMASVRPQVAGVCLLAALSQLGLTRGKPKLRAAALAGGLVIVLGLMVTTAYMLGLRSTDPAVVVEYVGRRLEGLTAAGNSNLDTLIYPFRLLSFLFRPLFLDAEGLFGIVVSLENVAFLLIFGALAWKADSVAALINANTAARFALLFGCMLLLVLGFVTFNLGAAVRQKTMIMPSVLLLFGAVLMLKGGRRGPAAAP